MTREDRRKFTIGGTILAALTAMMVLNDRAVVRGDDQYCYWDTEEEDCFDVPNKKCTDTQGWECRLSKDNGCQCTKNELEGG